VPKEVDPLIVPIVRTVGAAGLPGAPHQTRRAKKASQRCGHVAAGTDCGFAQEEINRRVHPSIMWAKLEAMVEGARIASRA
jgi:methionine synthase II (cobalamin-independent)